MKQIVQTIYVKAEDFRDKAWGVYPINDEFDLVLEMTHGYSDLYYSMRGTRQAMSDEVFFEEPSLDNINEWCRKMHQIEFINR